MSSAKIHIIGNLVRDPEMRQVGGQNVCHFSVGVRAREKDAEGNPISNFYECSLWGRAADFFMQRAQKGTLAEVSGQLTQRAYLGKDGTQRASLSVNADSAECLARYKGEGAAPAQQQTTQRAQRSPVSQPILPDDPLPF